MRILAIFLRSAAWEMFGDACHAMRSELRALKAPDVRAYKTGGELRVLTERPTDATPTRFRGEISHRMERHPQANCQILLSSDVRELLYNLIVADGAKANWLGPA
jgi:hypothetical protein